MKAPEAAGEGERRGRGAPGRVGATGTGWQVYEEARRDILETLRDEEPVAVPPAPGRSGRAVRILFLGVVAVHVLLAALVFNPGPHTGGDNAGYLSLALSLVERGEYLELWDPATPPHAKYPPAFPALLGAGIVLGLERWVAFKAMVVAVTGVAAGLVFLWARRVRGVLFAVAVALLFAASDALLWSSHWILSDPLFVLFTFVALWSFARVEGEVGGTRGISGGPPSAAPAAGAGGTGPGAVGWIALGAVGAILAYFTRSAGLPLVVAVLLWLALRRRWKALVGVAVCFAVPAGLWWARSRGLASAEYLSEFWMRDPYRPELGRIGPMELAVRVGENIGFYVGEAVPQGLAGFQGPLVVGAGVAVSVLAVAGWANRLLARPSVAELFFPLYWGLILLWPRVWSGDRLALPVLPLVLLYAGEAVVDSLRQVGSRTAVAGGLVAALAVAVPQGLAWRANAEATRPCAEWVRVDGAFGCYRERIREFAGAARWAGARLPEGSAVFSRKPRIFYAMSRHPGRVFPLEGGAGAFFDAAADAGIRYVVVDYVDDLAKIDLFPVLEERPGGFCYMQSFGSSEEPTMLLGILPPEERGEGGGTGEEEGALVLRMAPCPPAWFAEPPRSMPPRGSGVIPLLARSRR